MHSRVFDLAAERSVWSIPLIDTVPFKLRIQKLLVRSIDNDGEAFEVVPTDGGELQDIVTRLLADRNPAVLVRENGNIVGILTRFDVIGFIAE